MGQNHYTFLRKFRVCHTPTTEQCNKFDIGKSNISLMRYGALCDPAQDAGRGSAMPQSGGGGRVYRFYAGENKGLTGG